MDIRSENELIEEMALEMLPNLMQLYPHEDEDVLLNINDARIRDVMRDRDQFFGPMDLIAEDRVARLLEAEQLLHNRRAREAQQIHQQLGQGLNSYLEQRRSRMMY